MKNLSKMVAYDYLLTTISKLSFLTKSEQVWLINRLRKETPKLPPDHPDFTGYEGLLHTILDYIEEWDEHLDCE